MSGQSSSPLPAPRRLSSFRFLVASTAGQTRVQTPTDAKRVTAIQQAFKKCVPPAEDIRACHHQGKVIFQLGLKMSGAARSPARGGRARSAESTARAKAEKRVRTQRMSDSAGGQAEREFEPGP